MKPLNSVGVRAIVALSIAGLAVAACGPNDGSNDTEGPWRGTITTEGDVTKVVNESGSVWGGTATLIEEASIGVAVGPEEYMLVQVNALYATDDEIYVLDNGASKVRVYDLAGNHLRSFGREGQGPGEFGTFLFDVAVGPDGRIFVGDLTNNRISIYSREGEVTGQIPLTSLVSCCPTRLVFADGGGIWLYVRDFDSDSGSRREGVRVHTMDGPSGATRWVPDLEYDRRVVRHSGGEYEVVPFAARLEFTLGYDKALIVGASDRYEFQILHPGGGTTLVERLWRPTPVTADEVDYWRRMTIEDFSWAGGSLSWNGENIPDYKPAYLAMLPSLSGDLWLIRQGPASPADCEMAPEEMARVLAMNPLELPECLLGETIVDVFDGAGRYLGGVEGFPNDHYGAFISGDTVVAVVQDDAGTDMVKRYRLVLPGGASQ
jgi:hypothetical protein